MKTQFIASLPIELNWTSFCCTMMQPVIQWSYYSLHSKIAPPPLPSASSAFCKCTAKSSNVLFSQDVLEAFLLDKQMNMCDEAALADGSGKHFLLNKWNRGDDSKYGYGITRVIEGGNLFEKAGINVSIVRGYLSETRAKVLSARGQDVEEHAKYFAGALSAVFHPQNPYVPTFRCDVRYFEIEGGNGWFGGGADLTPCYLFEEDGHGFHSFYKHICSKYGSTLYAKSKAACDNYFYLPSRKEYRGIGGIFFDDLEKLEDDGRTFHHSKEGYMDESARIKSKRQSLEAVFCFVREVAEGFLPSYLPILEKRRGIKYGERERQWQLLRRGRYVEFNLLYDRGVKFGLDGGRIESIMVSAPPLVAWKYDIKPEPNSAESMLVDVLMNPRDWA